MDLPQNDNARGVYLREPEETASVFETAVRVRTVFPKNDEAATNAKKLALTKHLKLLAPQKWIGVPDYFVITNEGT